MDIRHAPLDRLPVKQAGKPCVGFPALPVCGGWLIYEEGFYTSACMKMRFRGACRKKMLFHGKIILLLFYHDFLYNGKR